MHNSPLHLSLQRNIPRESSPYSNRAAHNFRLHLVCLQQLKKTTITDTSRSGFSMCFVPCGSTAPHPHILYSVDFLCLLFGRFDARIAGAHLCSTPTAGPPPNELVVHLPLPTSSVHCTELYYHCSAAVLKTCCVCLSHRLESLDLPPGKDKGNRSLLPCTQRVAFLNVRGMRAMEAAPAVDRLLAAC